VRLRVLLIACALVVLALAGLRQDSDPSADPPGGLNASGQLSAQPAPEPSMPAVVGAAAKASTPSPTSLPSGPHRHLRPHTVLVEAARHAQRAGPGADRPRTFPLLI